ncbi:MULTISPECIES: FecR family protein [Xanthobacter]|uniref:FecR family protein n=1 Tax=Xanthobacter TaxID=279 RepID=UPI0035B1C37A
MTHTPPPSSAAVARPSIAASDRAIEWVVRVHSGAPEAEAEAWAFARWRAENPENEAAAREAEALWHGLGGAGVLARDAKRKASREKITRRALIGGGAFAVLGLGALAAGAVRDRLAADVATGVNEVRTTELPDGSRVLLNASTALALDFSATERGVRLLSGQAMFTVARDPARPFVVTAGDGRTRAIGTAFDVDIRPDGVVVTVVEGVVAVATATGGAGAILRADQSLRYDGRGRVIGPQAVNADAATAWRRGKLIFDRRPLVEVVAELQRHTHARIIIAGNRLKGLEVTGVFELDDPSAVLETIEQTLPVRVVRLPLINVIL